MAWPMPGSPPTPPGPSIPTRRRAAGAGPGARKPGAAEDLRRAGRLMARDACAVVLAGGESRRFGSDKALATFRGEPLVGRVLRLLREAGFAQVVLAAKDTAKYASFLPPEGLLRDVRPIQTPLAGLAAGLRASRHALVFACAADMPFAVDGP